MILTFCGRRLIVFVSFHLLVGVPLGVLGRMVLSFIMLTIGVFVVGLLISLKTLLIDYPVMCFTREEASPYECGFEQHSLSRVPVSIRYFLLTLVFLIFDMEIMLLIFTPHDILLGAKRSSVILVSIGFLAVLFLGLVFE